MGNYQSIKATKIADNIDKVESFKNIINNVEKETRIELYKEKNQLGANQVFNFDVDSKKVQSTNKKIIVTNETDAITKANTIANKNLKWDSDEVLEQKYNILKPKFELLREKIKKYNLSYDYNFDVEKIDFKNFEIIKNLNDFIKFFNLEDIDFESSIPILICDKKKFNLGFLSRFDDKISFKYNFLSKEYYFTKLQIILLIIETTIIELDLFNIVYEQKKKYKIHEFIELVGNYPISKKILSLTLNSFVSYLENIKQKIEMIEHKMIRNKILMFENELIKKEIDVLKECQKYDKHFQNKKEQQIQNYKLTRESCSNLEYRNNLMIFYAGLEKQKKLYEDDITKINYIIGVLKKSLKLTTKKS
jgi:hypothetical protein